MSNRCRQRWGWSLAAAFLFSITMATGPGLYLVNRPQIVFGIPLVYAWGILWYLVILLIAGLTFTIVWPPNEEE